MTRAPLGVLLAFSLAGCGSTAAGPPDSGTSVAPGAAAPGADATSPLPATYGAGPDASVGSSPEASVGNDNAESGMAPAPDSASGGGNVQPADSGPTDSGTGAMSPPDTGARTAEAGGGAPPGDAGVGWGTVPTILARIVPPTFRNVDCILTDPKYGGNGDGVTDNTAAFAMAIADCAGGGGGRVVVPSGTFFTGPIVLQSNINLYLAAATSVIKFTTDSTKYYPLVETSFEGTLIMNYHPFISANGATNIAITGTGTLEGNATMNDWYAWGSADPKYDLAPRLDNAAHKLPITSRIYGDGNFLRPSLIEFMNCKNILLDGFTAQHSPFWTIHPVMSSNITGRNLTIIGTVGNTDGFDPESCVDVLLSNLTIQVGDDSIAIKAGRDLDGRTFYTPTKNVVIQNCHLSTGNPGHGGAISVGSEMSASVSNVYVQNITYTTGLSAGLQAQAIYLKGSNYRGGFIKDFYARQLTVDQISTLFWANGQYSDPAPAGRPVDLIQIDNINVDGVMANAVTSGAFWLTGADATRPETNIHLSNITVGQGAAFGAANRVAHYAGLTTTNVTVSGAAFNPPASAP